MDRTAAEKRDRGAFLYPPIEPYDQRLLAVGDGHRVYVEQCGNPAGRTVLVLHGGPGGGASPAMRRYFDPEVYRVVLFDQRGCGRSKPAAAVEANTTAHLIADIETIRAALSIDDFILFGGSWGATLALLYGEAHPERVRQFVLRGVFLATRAELNWFYGGGAGAFWPDLWRQFSEMVPEAERGDMIGAYHRRLFSGDRATEVRFARIWAHWENALASVEGEAGIAEAPPEYVRTFARLENHYFHHGAFLADDDQILRERPKIEHIPAVIVQGRLDMVCPPATAWALADGWQKAELRLVAGAGHALSEPRITAELLRVMNGLRGA